MDFEHSRYNVSVIIGRDADQVEQPVKPGNRLRSLRKKKSPATRALTLAIAAVHMHGKPATPPRPEQEQRHTRGKGSAHIGWRHIYHGPPARTPFKIKRYLEHLLEAMSASASYHCCRERPYRPRRQSASLIFCTKVAYCGSASERRHIRYEKHLHDEH